MSDAAWTHTYPSTGMCTHTSEPWSLSTEHPSEMHFACREKQRAEEHEQTRSLLEEYVKTAVLHVTCLVAPTPAPYTSSFPDREGGTAPLLLPPCWLGNPRGRHRQHVFSSVITEGVMLILLGFSVLC